VTSRRRKLVGIYDVSGPNSEDRSAPSEGSALSLAQFLASAWSKPGTWYIRRLGTVVATVERDDHGSIISQRTAIPAQL
jgi:hypothetical protein